MTGWLLSIVLSGVLPLGGPVFLVGLAVLVFVRGMERLAIIIAAGGAIWFATGAVYQQGRDAARAEITAAVTKEALKWRDHVRKVEDQADLDAAASEDLISSLEERTTALAAELALEKNDACILTPDDEKRLAPFL